MAHPQADLFRQLADKIEKNDEKDFAGAFLVVPPTGDSISSLLVGEADIATFFGVVKSKIDIVINKIDAEEKQKNAFGGRR